MKRLFILLLLLPFVQLRAQFEDYILKPSYYFTYGDYSNGDISRSHAGYLTLQYTKNFYFTSAYEKVDIISKDWKYGQHMLLGGMLYSAFPYYIKGYYAHLQGDFRLNTNTIFDASVFNYSDNTNIFSLDGSTYFSGWILGGSVTSVNASGMLNVDSLTHQRVWQGVARIEYSPIPGLFLSLKPAFSYLEDGRRLFSASVKTHYRLFDDVLLKAGAAAGKRAYYFDTDLLTIYNQDDTQKWNASFQVEYTPIEEVTLVASAITTKFDIYRINYFVAGIKSSLALW